MIRVSSKVELPRWHLPERDGEMPIYVQRDFRVKVFALLSMQLLSIFSEMLLVRLLLHPWLADRGLHFVFVALGILAIALVFFLHRRTERFPSNYALVLLITLVVGIVFGLAPEIFGSHLPVQLLGILAVASVLATALLAVLTRKDLKPRTTLLISVSLSWATAAYLDVYITQHWALVSPAAAGVAVLMSLMLLSMWLLLDSGRRLITCNPDDLVVVIVCMYSVLLLVSLPIFVLTMLPNDVEADDELAAAPQEVEAHVVVLP